MNKSFPGRSITTLFALAPLLTPNFAQAQDKPSRQAEAAIVRMQRFIEKHGVVTSDDDGVHVVVHTTMESIRPCTVLITQNAQTRTSDGQDIHYGTKQIVDLSTMSPTAQKGDLAVPGGQVSIFFTSTRGDSSVTVSSFVEKDPPEMGLDHEAILEFALGTNSDSATKVVNAAITLCGGKVASKETKGRIDALDSAEMRRVKTMYGLDLTHSDSVAVVAACRDKIKLHFDKDAILDYDKSRPLITHKVETGQFEVIGSVNARDGKPDTPYACILEQTPTGFRSTTDRIIPKH